MRPPLHNIRVNLLHPIYAELAREHGCAFEKARSQTLLQSKTHDETAWRAADNLAVRSAISCVVFCALSLEAQIYDFAARYLGDGYVAQHLDKLDLVSKWLVIPLLVTGREIDKSGAAYGQLKVVVKARNGLVHYKSDTFSAGGSIADEMPALHDKKMAELDAAAKAAIKAIDDLPETLYLMSSDAFVFMSLPEQRKAKHRDDSGRVHAT
ncbi:MAG: hypothetical protein JNL39_05595 [Opitutaceae bacterium]|nr:hypothetical protein [Opitutaceae bacterium]